jgi:glycogen synthase
MNGAIYKVVTSNNGRYNARRPAGDLDGKTVQAIATNALAERGVRRAFATFMAKDRLDSMRRRAMSRSFSWDVSAACYSALYRKALSS